MPQVGGFGDDGWAQGTERILHGLSAIDLGIVLGQFQLVGFDRLLLGLPPGNQALGSFVELFLERHGPGIGTLDFPRHPSFNRRTREGSLNDAHGDFQFLMELLSKIVGDCGSLGGGLRITGFPTGQAVPVFLERFMPMLASRTVNPKTGKIDLGLPLGLKGVAHRPTHIGLPRAKPDFTNRDVSQNDAVASPDGQSVVQTGGGGVDHRHPFAVFPGGQGVFLSPACGDGHLLSGLGPPPDWVAVVLLKHEMVGKDCGQADLGGRNQGQNEEKQDCETLHGSELRIFSMHASAKR